MSGNVAAAAKADSRRVTGGQTVRVRRVESATTMVRVPTPDGRALSSATAMSKTGQAVEIRPLFDPTVLRVGRDIPLPPLPIPGHTPPVNIRD